MELMPAKSLYLSRTGMSVELRPHNKEVNTFDIKVLSTKTVKDS